MPVHEREPHIHSAVRIHHPGEAPDAPAVALAQAPRQEAPPPTASEDTEAAAGGAPERRDSR